MTVAGEPEVVRLLVGLIPRYSRRRDVPESEIEALVESVMDQRVTVVYDTHDSRPVGIVSNKLSWLMPGHPQARDLLDGDSA